MLVPGYRLLGKSKKLHEYNTDIYYNPLLGGARGGFLFIGKSDDNNDNNDNPIYYSRLTIDDSRNTF